MKREFIALRTREALAKRRASGRRAPGAPQRETRGAAQTRCAGGHHPRLPGQGDQQAGDCQTDRVRAVDPLCVVGPAQPSPLPWRGTYPRPFGNAVRGLVSGGKEPWG